MKNMITNHEPDTWQQLQSEVGRILSECNLSVEVEKMVKTVRGNVNIDVYAEEAVSLRRNKIVIECKHWKRGVPQTIIHSFRTVVSDIGANVGYLISLRGFQSGAFNAAELTNLELVTWKEFQLRFVDSWYESYFIPLIAQALHPLLTNTLELLSMKFENLPDSTQIIIHKLKLKYEVFVAVIEDCIPLHPLWFPQISTTVNLPLLKILKQGVLKPEARIDLPIIKAMRGEHEILDSLPLDILEASGYREFYTLALEYAYEVIDHELMQDIINSLRSTKYWDYYKHKLLFAYCAILRFDKNWDDDYLTLSSGLPLRDHLDYLCEKYLQEGGDA